MGGFDKTITYADFPVDPVKIWLVLNRLVSLREFEDAIILDLQPILRLSTSFKIKVGSVVPGDVHAPNEIRPKTKVVPPSEIPAITGGDQPCGSKTGGYGFFTPEPSSKKSSRDLVEIFFFNIISPEDDQTTVVGATSPAGVSLKNLRELPDVLFHSP